MTNWKRSRNADSDDETSDTSQAQTADTTSSSAAVRDGSPKPLAAAALEHARVETHLEAATFDNSAAAVDLADSAVPRLFGRDEGQIQRSLEGTDTTIDEVPGKVLDVLSNGGQPLDQPVQRALEERMDADFSDVRIHTGGTAAKAAEAIDAKAFTCGNDIVFNSGEYDPESPEGQHLLAHELAHVKQQNGGAPISMMPQEGADLEIDPDPQLEREADAAAEQALSGEEPLVVNRLGTDVHIQRSAKDETPEEFADLLQEAEDGAVEADNEAFKEYVKDGFGPLGTLVEKTSEIFGNIGRGAREMDQEDWAEVVVKTGLKIVTAGAAGEVLDNSQDVVTQAANQAKTTAENKVANPDSLQDIGISEEWESILADSPSQWASKIKDEAVKAAKAATGTDLEGHAQGGNV
ncbi:DUF4157 domain-containing protein [Natrarchaeobaculum aegyptiacum]|uniref:eCIS core domain-containing protein n=1 Tax=Natrarchaeobaculum aegyptiacum TaxID=745377 RepID=UPI001E4D3A85|nr:DUF4157 domain-containing protein [Natrarchaeobaculum aegyptiacum]